MGKLLKELMKRSVQEILGGIEPALNEGPVDGERTFDIPNSSTSTYEFFQTFAPAFYGIQLAASVRQGISYELQILNDTYRLAFDYHRSTEHPIHLRHKVLKHTHTRWLSGGPKRGIHPLGVTKNSQHGRLKRAIDQ